MSKNKNFYSNQTKPQIDTTTPAVDSTEPSSDETTTETTSAPTVAEAPVAAVEATVTVEPETVKPAESAPAIKPPVAKAKSKEGFTPVYKVELELNNYAEAMDRTKSIIPEEGGKWQYSLFTNIKSVFNAKSQEEFNAEFNTVLHFFNKNKDGVFNEKFIFRFPEYWGGSPNEFTFYRRIIYLIIQTADVKGRKKALESINLAMVAEGLTENQRNMMFNFYLQ